MKIQNYDNGYFWQSAIVVLLLFMVVLAYGQIYRWVDKSGNVHYSDQPPPEEIQAEEWVAPPGLSVDLSRERRGDVQSQVERSDQRKSKTVQSLPLSALGPLPENESSEYLESVSTGVGYDIKTFSGNFSIWLKASPKLPRGAYLEAHFPNPSDPDSPHIVSKVRQGATPEIYIKSPALIGLKCWNYEVAIYVYRGRSKTAFLGTHHQVIQSRINLDSIRDKTDWMDATTALAQGKGRCP